MTLRLRDVKWNINEEQWFYTSHAVPSSFTSIDDRCLDSLRPFIFHISKDFSCLGKVSVLFVFFPTSQTGHTESVNGQVDHIAPNLHPFFMVQMRMWNMTLEQCVAFWMKGLHCSQGACTAAMQETWDRGRKQLTSLHQ